MNALKPPTFAANLKSKEEPNMAYLTSVTKRILAARLLGTILLVLFISGCRMFKPGAAPKERIFPQPEREFRGVWVATVANIDWPSEPGLATDQQKCEALAILDSLQKRNINAVIFQVRPQCDAFYNSKLEPWSYYLTGRQGAAPDPYYDPLEFWISEAHKRSMELHAWFNPYRAHHPKGGPVTAVSIVKRKPGLVKKLENGYYWLDPARKGTQDHSFAVVMDVVRRYDIDGVHFDDYFYPYPSYNNGKDFPDEDGYQVYLKQGGRLSRGDWRRKAVNDFIRRVYRAIKQTKPWVKFGLSPFGIYRPGHPASISGFDQYRTLYADARLWLNQGWVDYWAPQLYWPINRVRQSFPVLLGWWLRENKKQRHVWPGLFTSRVKDAAGVDENLNQIMIVRGFEPDAPGHIHFSAKAFLDTSAILSKALLTGPYRRPALIPPSPWLDDEPPQPPRVRTQLMADSVSIRWTHGDTSDVFRWVVYFRYGDRWNYQILNRSQMTFTLPYRLSADENKVSSVLTRVVVTAVDRTGNESPRTILPVTIPQ